ncbi:MAG: cyclohexanone monooxygenase, partial [Geminicoccaceae bacterium]
ALEASEEERLAEYERRWQEGGLLFMQSYGDFLLNKEANDSLTAFVHDKIRSIVTDPETAEMLCPDNIIGAKRLCVDTNYYATYNRDNVRLVDIRKQPISVINQTGLRVGDTQYDVDIMVIATGFDAMTGALTHIDIHGRNGAPLNERWRDGPSSYLGLAMADFPNLFTVTGPGSPSVLTNMLPTIEQHVEWITDCIAHARSSGCTVVEARAEAERAWWRHVQEVGRQGLKGTTNSWYIGANVDGKARVFMPYNGGFPDYCRKCEEEVANGYEGFALG